MIRKRSYRSLSYYNLNSYNEMSYIKRFVNGVSKEELEQMFTKHLLNSFLTVLIGTHLANNIGVRRETWR